MQCGQKIKNLKSCASQVMLVVKNPPATAGDIEMRVQSLGGEDPLEEGMATHSSILVWRIPMDRGVMAAIHGVPESQIRLSN